jgi:hypothetical protein
MERRSGYWLAAAAVFTVGNLAGGVVAAVQREWMHASIHVGLTLIGAIATWQLVQRREARVLSSASTASLGDDTRVENRMTQLEQSIEAIGIEAERIGEGQRRITELFAKQGVPRNDGEPDTKKRPQSS